MSMNDNISKIACLGTGVIGAAWVARFIENGFDVTVFDPSPRAEKIVADVIANADRAYAKLYAAAPRRKKGSVSFASTLDEAVLHADLIVESVPESLEIKHKTYAHIEAAGNTHGLICSSTSGLIPSDLQRGLEHPERLLVAHPFNPVYLIPVVEIVGGNQTDDAAVKKAIALYQHMGMKPVHIKKEIEAFVADRLLEALWRESLWLINDGICTTEELDDIIRYGFGLRFAQMGIFETYRLAGGEAGMRHFMAQFGPCLKWPWTKLMDVPDLDDALIDKIADQSHAQSGHYGVRELEQIRDDNLIAIQQGLRAHRWGVGEVLAAHEARLLDETAEEGLAYDFHEPEPVPVQTFKGSVRGDWVDYNGHMNEARYLDCFCNSTDYFLRMIGVDQTYLNDEGSYFTVETHIRHLNEARVGTGLYATLQLLNGVGKKLHVFQSLFDENHQLLATCEQMLIHVSLKTRKASLPSDELRNRLALLHEAHAHLPHPEGLGRAVGDQV